MDFYTNSPVLASDKTEDLFNELNVLKDQMMENMDLSLQRSGKIEATLARSDSLVGTA
eukprot:CAMPEP_0176371252 /NCGR_PEP_ID=MMETSP0126-20121128/24566_1 /TAXON_ID=141414 ORGANISM="Strombidinopsis acuminatum, Strain SPMC142" /NCGR_SAMPLE_ID=MMETSP0126 /ASSEMBLY_ACC=CAM_ASM_000229 /LENGTH=57 /DNA_ID=CAMNT_0017730631 /DNA_START=361 /DNA_END=534 /DNA_ORIENTATION=-